MGGSGDITGLLNAWSDGDAAAGEALTPLVYDELHRISARLFRGEKGAHTLQPTALVHEAYVKLVKADVTWQGRSHFYALAARMMKRLLINHAEARRAEKRGGGAVHVTLEDGLVKDAPEDIALLALTDAIGALEAMDPRKAELIQLQYFGGLSLAEIETVTGLSQSTIVRDLRFARAWLKTELTGA
jgi:RNA polymerase sigma factor (TIGR02999 family)